jgi:hypothetical protein
MSLNKANMDCVADLVTEGIIPFDKIEDCPSRLELRHAYICAAQTTAACAKALAEELSKNTVGRPDEVILSPPNALMVDDIRTHWELIADFRNKAINILNPVTKAYHDSMKCITGNLTGEDSVAEARLVHSFLPKRTQIAFPSKETMPAT